MRKLEAAAIPVLAAAMLALAACGGTTGSPAATTSNRTRPTTTTPAPTTTLTPSQLAALPAQQLQSLALSATVGAHSSGFSAVEQDGARTLTIDGTAGTATGIVSISVMAVVRTAATEGHLTAEIDSGGLYVNGDAAALTSLAQIPPVAAGKAAGGWILVLPTDPSYTALNQDVTLPELATAITLAAPTSAGLSTLAGQSVVKLEGKSPSGDSCELDVAASGEPLPVLYSCHGQGTSSFVQISFTEWGGAVGVEAPGGAIPYASAAIG